MKKRFFMLLAAVLLSSASVFAQNENTIIQRGDMNGDGNIDISDVVALVNYILNREITVGVTGIELDKTELTIPTNETGTIKATIEPFNATNKNVNWTSSDESVATVTASTTSGGNATVTWKKAGTTIITARAAGDTSKSATCTVTCNPANTYYWYVGTTIPTTVNGTVNNAQTDKWTSLGTTKPTQIYIESESDWTYPNWYVAIPTSFNFQPYDMTGTELDLGSWDSNVDITTLSGYSIWKLANNDSSLIAIFK